MTHVAPISPAGLAGAGDATGHTANALSEPAATQQAAQAASGGRGRRLTAHIAPGFAWRGFFSIPLVALAPQVAFLLWAECLVGSKSPLNQ